MTDLRTLRPKRHVEMLACGKCLKRAENGKAIRRALKAVVRAQGGDGGRKGKMLRTGCFGICPKRAVVVATLDMLAAGKVAIVSSHVEVTSLQEMTVETGVSGRRVALE